MHRSVLGGSRIGALAGLALIAAVGESAAAPVAATHALRAALAELALVERAQFIHLGQPYCWYPYGWAGPGWYWCGYGTRFGLGWGGGHGWNGWVAPRGNRGARYVPKSRYRRY